MMIKQTKKISLVIPLKNESGSLVELVESIKRQTFQPDEIVLVDGGSTDNTVEMIKGLASEYPKLKLIETPKASPGKGRNIGVENSQYEWIAFTDAGIKLEEDWLEYLVKEIEKDPEVDIVYGNYSPMTNTFFEKCATLAYVAPLRENSFREKFIASSLLRKKVWEKVGGFPDLRAAEDLIFMEAAEKACYKTAFAPKAKVHWQLRPNLSTTFNKFVSYSKHNVLAGRQWDWHYGILRQYVLVLPFLLLSFYSIWFSAFVLLWLFARTFKRILPHRYEFGLETLFNPIVFVSVAFLILTIDLATLIGWIKAIFKKSEN